MQEQHGHDDLEQVAGRLPERRGHGQRAVVVGEDVADQQARPQADAAEVEKRDPDSDRQPDDCRDGPGELECIADLRRAVVRGRQHHDSQRERRTRQQRAQCVRSTRDPLFFPDGELGNYRT